MIRKQPFTIEINGITARVIKYELHFWKDSIATLENSGNLYFKVPFGYMEPVTGDSNTLDTAFFILVFDGTIGEPIIILETSGRIFKYHEMVDKPNDVWLLVEKMYSLIQEEIDKEGIKDRIGNVIKLPS